MAERRPALGHQPALDGVRGIAILAVVGYHYQFLPGGGAGVTVFFTLSGFLITCLLLEEFDATARISLKNFYIRRALRLLPALAVLLLVDLATVLAWSSGWDRKANLAAIVATVAYSSNWVAALGLFPLYQLSHTWSLSVEEQFYLLWPLALLWLCRSRVPRPRLMWVLLALAVISSIERFWLAAAGVREIRLFYGLDTRADALLFGAAVAAAFHGGRWRSPAAARAVGVIAVGCAVLLAGHLFLGLAAVNRSTEWLSVGNSTAVGALSAVTLLALATDAPAIRAVKGLLTVRPLTFIGQVSYGLYLWHPLGGVLVAHLAPPMSVAVAPAVNFSVSLLITVTSFYLVERPCLRLKRRFEPARMRRAS